MNRKKQTIGQTPIVPYVAVINLLHNNNYPLIRLISLLIIEELIIQFICVHHTCQLVEIFSLHISIIHLYYTPNASKTMDSSNSGVFNYIKELAADLIVSINRVFPF